MSGSGKLYAAFGADAYLAMAVLSSLGAIGGWLLEKTWRGEKLAE
jgi:hypothetical protein